MVTGSSSRVLVSDACASLDARDRAGERDGLADGMSCLSPPRPKACNGPQMAVGRGLDPD